MVAASKMRKAQQAALAARPFARLLYRIQRSATARARDFTHPLLTVREVRRDAVILIAADKGLCGALNTNVFRLAAQFDSASTLYITAGRKAAQFVARLIDVIDSQSEVAEGVAEVVFMGLPIVSEFNDGVVGFVAVADEGQGKFAGWIVSFAQQLHAQNVTIELDRLI
jgi:F-type H+-transporting ATPase subunit gamma